MNKIVNILKPTGMTSHDVVSRVRRILNMKKVGHTGTLDPDAAGVLPICLNKATKVSELILNKEYGRMVAVVNNEISSVPLSVAVEKPKRVNPNDEIVKQVRMMGICLGD